MAFVYWIHLPEHTDPKTQGYVGITTKTVARRFSSHRRDARRGSHLVVHRAIRKHPSMQVSTVHEGSAEFCQLLEWAYRPLPNIGWNLNQGGDKPRTGTSGPGSMAGRKHTHETIARMKETARGKQLPESALTRMREVRANPTAATRLKMSVASKARSPWECGRANRDVWAQAEEVFQFFRLSPSTGHVKAATIFGFARGQLLSMYQRFEAGWNPLEDAAWLKFSQSIKETQ